MKIALCLSGQVRALKDTYPTFKANLLEPLQPDVFIHSWEDIRDHYHFVKGSIGNKWLGKMNWIRRRSWFREDQYVRENQSMKNNDLERELKELFKPINMRLDNYFLKQRQFVNDKYLTRKAPETVPERVLAMHHSIQEANTLKAIYETQIGFTYDWVIRCRFDLEICAPLPIPHSAERVVYIPNPECDFGGINDQLAFGPSNLMNLYSSASVHLDEYWEKGCLFHPESLLKYHLKEQAVPLKRFTLNYKIKRPLVSDKR